MLAVGFIPRLDVESKTRRVSGGSCGGASRNGSGVAERKATPIQPSLTRRASGGGSDRGMNPTANMKCPYGTETPSFRASPPYRGAHLIDLPLALSECGERSPLSGRPDRQTASGTPMGPPDGKKRQSLAALHTGAAHWRLIGAED